MHPVHPQFLMQAVAIDDCVVSSLAIRMGREPIHAVG